MKISRVNVRGSYQTSAPFGTECPDTEIIGWFCNKYNTGGWTVSTMSDFDVEWFKSQDVSIENVFRIASDNGMSIAKFDFERGRVAFFDNEFYVNTDKIKFERFYVFDRFFFDNWQDFVQFCQGQN